ncbi:MAG: hypothetical protein IKB41_01735 [Clostridia bacterium]|nr:hypothetical protein [Clostridia bacterium]
MKSKTLSVRAIKIAGDVLLYLFIAICLVALILSIVSKKGSDGAATVLGYQLRLVQSPSMEACEQTDVSGYKIKDIPTKSMVFIEVMPEDPSEAAAWYAELAVGDVLTFKYVYTTQETITHRIVSIEENDHGGYSIELQGDNKSEDADTLIQTIDTALINSPNYVIGKVVAVSVPFGYFVHALKSPVGIVCIIMVPCAIIIVLEIIRIISVVSAENRKKQRAIKAQQQNEIEELKKQLELLQAAQNEVSSTSTDVQDIKTQNLEEQE